MATPKPKPAIPETTAAWGRQEAEVLAGADLVDKAELVGKTFAITGFMFTHNDKAGIAYAYLEGEFEPGGDRFQFNDASTGVRAQIEAFAAGKGLTPALDEWTDTLIVCPRGLRRSEYDAFDNRGKPVRAKTYYLTTSGTRA